MKIQGNFARFYPDIFHPYLEKPHSMMVAEGSPVRVMQGQTIS
ncbi:hypothetical protein [Oligoflexus sp.]|nr:hypothetical protein [Oligoflexus sp.]